MTPRDPSPRRRLRAAGTQSHQAVLDLLGIGFGPSNLALAVAARELDATQTGLFFERSAKFHWHSAMVLDGATMQISFLKDLATLRNPSSPYTFLQYVKAKGRLQRFVNLRDFYPTRLEYQDYLSWVAEAFAEQVRYGSTVTRVSPVARAGERVPWCFRVQVRDVQTLETAEYLARNVIYAPGGTPRIPSGLKCVSPRVIHSSEFLTKFPSRFADTEHAWEFAVAGDGQSAGEIVSYLLGRFPRARVHLLVSGCSPHASDDSHFINEQFSSESLDTFYRSGAAKRGALLAELRNTNYGVIESRLLGDIYHTSYLDEVKGQRRLFVHPFSRLTTVAETGDRLRATVEDGFGGPLRRILCDSVLLATGYERTIDPVLFADVLPLCERDASGNVAVHRNYRVRTLIDMPCGLYVQGCTESAFGPGETLLSMLPFRSEDIFREIMTSSDDRRWKRIPQRLQHAEYPPKRHIETSVEKLYAVMERFRFATLISTGPDDEPVVTQVPLILDRSRGARGVLFGHMDRANPHVDLLDRRSIVAIFHGPNAYISPKVYTTEQLPTWNSIAVHVRGRVTIVNQREPLVAGLCGIARQCDCQPNVVALSPDDPRIERLIEFIVGFEIEIEEMTGRFKLSQDRTDVDRRRAALALARHTEKGERAFIERMVGLSLDERRDQPDLRIALPTHERRVV